MANFYEEPVRCFQDIIRNQKSYWIYRGHIEASWSLQPSLERYCMDFCGNLADAKELERRFMREFRRRYHHYSIHAPQIDRRIEWLSLMQHYGAPTRLLDWTYSIYVALYFAIEKKNKSKNENEPEDHAVWAMSAEWCLKEAIHIVKCNPVKQWHHLVDPICESNERYYSSTFLDPPHMPLVYPINPFRLTERLVAQKGVFVIPGDISKTFEENLSRLQGYDDKNNLVKLKIPHRKQKEFLKKLNDMGINRANLFPGLDGFAKSLAVYPPPAALYGSALDGDLSGK